MEELTLSEGDGGSESTLTESKIPPPPPPLRPPPNTGEFPLVPVLRGEPRFRHRANRVRFPHTERRRVRDRWYYAPEGVADATPEDGQIQESSSIEVPIEDDSLTHAQVTQLVKRFNVEGRNCMSILKARMGRE
jgi:hypothetical protein